MGLMQFSEPRKAFIADSGEYKCRFVEVQQVAVKNTYPDAKTDTVDKLVWTFETTEVGDEDGNPIQFKQWTSTYYGGDRSTLTQFIDMVFGQRFEKSQLGQVEAGMPHLEYELSIERAVSQGGKEFNRIVGVRYRDPRKQPAMKPLKKAQAEEPITDPFAE